MERKLVKVINDDKLYKAKNGKEYKRTGYYLVTNGIWTCIRPAFEKDYMKLDFQCDEIIHNGKSSK